MASSSLAAAAVANVAAMLLPLPRAHDHGDLTDDQIAETLLDPYDETPKYARGVVYFVCAGIALFALARAVLAVRARKPSVATSRVYGRTVALARYVATRQQRVPWVGWICPSLGMSLVILAFFTFVFTWTWAIRPYYCSQWNVCGSPLAMRSGLMALGCFPFIMAFASKWNFVTFITGHSHEKLQVYHQYMSYIFLVLSLIHSFPWVIQGMREVKPGFEPLTQLEWSWHVAKKVYYWSGAALLIILAYLCVPSLPLFRRRHYEFFKYLHIVSALLFIAFFFVHCNRLLGSWDYLYATVAVYGAAVVGRFGWMVYVNMGQSPRGRGEVMEGGMVRVRVKVRGQRWMPGQHYFFHFLSVSPWQSHPFTIASIPSEDGSGEQEMVVLVRAANGITKRLLKHVSCRTQAQGASSPSSSAPSSSASEVPYGPEISLPVFLDGPYGGIRTDLTQFEHVVLVAGGTGMTFVLPVLLDIVKRMRRAENGAERKYKESQEEGAGGGAVVCKSVQVIWSVREKECISWVLADLEKAVAEAPVSAVSVKIHVTRGGGSSDKEKDDGSSSSSQSEDDEKNLKEDKPLSHPWYGRPNVKAEIEDAAANARTLGVAACGPAEMVFDVRNAVAGIEKGIALGSMTGCREVYLHTEEYDW